MQEVTLHHSECLTLLKTLPACSVDSVVTDPPCGIGFMGLDWDKNKGSRNAWIAWATEIAVECRRVLRHGGHAVVWALPRTSHWTMTAWEDAGFEVRDRITHGFGSGFPKSTNLGNGQGTALKPAMEDWVLLRKPIEKGLTIKKNVEKHGTGGLQIDKSRIPFVSDADKAATTTKNRHTDFGTPPTTGNNTYGDWSMCEKRNYTAQARFPANFIYDGSEVWEAIFAQSGVSGGGKNTIRKGSIFEGKTVFKGLKAGENTPAYTDTGTPARYFYCAKPSVSEKEAGLHEGKMKYITHGHPPKGNHESNGQYATANPRRNFHPTVKAQALMQYLVQLVTPEGGTVLDPFMGSGSTGVAAVSLGFSFIGIEQDVDYVRIATQRIAAAKTP